MAKFSSIEVSQMIEKQGLMPVFYHDDLTICKQVMTSCYKAGLRIFEFTNRGEFAYHNFSELIKYVESALPEMILGAGSILDSNTASLFMEAGANFIVAPIVKKSVAEICNSKKILWIPGCGSVTEISNAEELGAAIVKIFPGSILGPEFIKAVKGPMPWVKMMVTGGVEPTEENLKSWFGSGAVCVGIGSQLFDNNRIKSGKFIELENDIKNALQIIKKYK